MFKMFIQDPKVAEKLLIRKLSNNMLKPLQLKMSIFAKLSSSWLVQSSSAELRIALKKKVGLLNKYNKTKCLATH